MFWFALVPWILGRGRDRGDEESHFIGVVLGVLVLVLLALFSSPVLVWKAADKKTLGDPAVKVSAVVSYVTIMVLIWLILGPLLTAVAAIAVTAVAAVYLERG